MSGSADSMAGVADPMGGRAPAEWKRAGTPRSGAAWGSDCGASSTCPRRQFCARCRRSAPGRRSDTLAVDFRVARAFAVGRSGRRPIGSACARLPWRDRGSVGSHRPRPASGGRARRFSTISLAGLGGERGEARSSRDTSSLHCAAAHALHAGVVSDVVWAAPDAVCDLVLCLVRRFGSVGLAATASVPSMARRRRGISGGSQHLHMKRLLSPRMLMFARRRVDLAESNPLRSAKGVERVYALAAARGAPNDVGLRTLARCVAC